MARITIDDCLEQVENSFDLTLLAAQRALQIIQGSEPHLSRSNDKTPVIALREIAEKLSTTESVEVEEKRMERLRTEIPDFANRLYGAPTSEALE